MQIKDLMAGVRRKLANRDDVDANSPIWIKDAVLELTESYPHQELWVNGPVTAFTVNNPEYPITTFTNNNELPTIINSWFVSSTTSMPTTSGGGRYIKYREIPVLDLMSKSKGQVSKWTLNGNNFLVGNNPDRAYATQMRYQRKHPFTANLFDAVSLQNDVVFMPDSWSIVIEMQAAIIGAYELRMLDYAGTYHQALYGDPDFKKTGRGNPGLIFSRTSAHDRFSSGNERQLQMVVLKSVRS